jgi:hypothetical protein
VQTALRMRGAASMLRRIAWTKSVTNATTSPGSSSTPPTRIVATMTVARAAIVGAVRRKCGPLGSVCGSALLVWMGGVCSTRLALRCADFAL